MDVLIHFFRDVLDGPIYWIIVVICVLAILAILGYLLDRSNKVAEEAMKIAATPDGTTKVNFESYDQDHHNNEQNLVTNEQIIDFNTPTSDNIPEEIDNDLLTKKPKNDEENIIDFSSTSTGTIIEPIPEAVDDQQNIEKFSSTTNLNIEDIVENNDILEINSEDKTNDEIVLTPGDK